MISLNFDNHSKTSALKENWTLFLWILLEKANASQLGARKNSTTAL